MTDLKSMLRESGVKQRDVAMALGVSEPTASRIVNGRQELVASQITVVATILGCGVVDILRASSASRAAAHQDAVARDAA